MKSYIFISSNAEYLRSGYSLKVIFGHTGEISCIRALLRRGSNLGPQGEKPRPYSSRNDIVGPLCIVFAATRHLRCIGRWASVFRTSSLSRARLSSRGARCRRGRTLRTIWLGSGLKQALSICYSQADPNAISVGMSVAIDIGRISYNRVR